MIVLIHANRFVSSEWSTLEDFELAQVRKLISRLKDFLFEKKLHAMIEDTFHGAVEEIGCGVGKTSLTFDVRVYGESTMLANDESLASGSVFKELASFLENHLAIDGHHLGSNEEFTLTCAYYKDPFDSDFVEKKYSESFSWNDCIKRI